MPRPLLLSSGSGLWSEGMPLSRCLAALIARAEGATLDDLREAVTTLESVAKPWKRVLGAAHPDTSEVQSALAFARNKLARAAAAAAESKAPP